MEKIISLKQFYETYKTTNIVTIHEFSSSKVLQEIKNYQWWSYAILPDNNIWTVKYDNKISPENINECSYNLDF